MSGLLALVGVVYSAWSDSRSKGHDRELEGERLGHDELVAALEFQRRRIEDLERRAENAERMERECNRKLTSLERRVSDLLLIVEMRRENKGRSDGPDRRGQ